MIQDDGILILEGGETMLNKDEIAKEIGVSKVTIERWMKKGMPHMKAPNGTVRFELESIKEWMKVKNSI